ncbi:cellulase family glycosylhydrolase [Aliagarivorans marinus]|uniref:cellulase family glycosylhydrolase n=1 Tax=Aliagarivorans marinus TaxID=561965 RepID=UPI00040FB6CF|nr:cellulase family glycosylhydrolase [Aliagarivorans marinus]
MKSNIQLPLSSPSTFVSRFAHSRLAAGICGLLLATTVDAGFTTSGTQLLDANGHAVVMRGVNHAHAWYNYRQGAFRDIAELGANTVRVVLSDGQQFAKNEAEDVAKVVQMCKLNRLVCLLEVHDVTGSGEKPEAGDMQVTAQYWLELADVLKGEEDYVIINIANEPFGNNVPASTYVEEHQLAIQTLRDAGFTHTLMVDAANWGQDWQEIMLEHASDIAAADTLNNIMFSVHMYQVYPNREKIEGYVSRFLNTHNLPLIVGEFGPNHQGEEVDEDAILAVAEEYQIGYLGWSWSGNTAPGTFDLDMTVNFDPNKLTPWGERLFNGPNGIKETSILASVYDGQTLPEYQYCDYYGTVIPICLYEDGGHGQENGANCVGLTLCQSVPEGSGGVIGDGGNGGDNGSGGDNGGDNGSGGDNGGGDNGGGSTPDPQGACQYTVKNSWQGGFEAAISISNTGDAAIEGWSVAWTYLDGSTVSSLWNANATLGETNQASALEWNKLIAVGGSVEFGFTGVGKGEQVQLSGELCE